MKKSCIYPLTTLNLTNGSLLPCCASHLPTYEAELLMIPPENAMDAWNSPEWKRFRRKIADDDYGACHACPVFAQKTESWYTEEEIKEKYPEVYLFKKGNEYIKNVPIPSTVIVSFDDRCNLHKKVWAGRCRPFRAA